ncbi:MAG: sigma-70 family RNA polymerase sigma factor [Candidatus Eisenbacteria bacterium]|nr:sigma-70 family RNA polymerase sigma factor [Candidatus Eisenbacteria bacterium]
MEQKREPRVVDPSAHDVDTRALVKRLARGEREAWESFIARYRRLIFSAIHRVNERYGAAWDEADMEELFEEAVFKLLRRDGRALRSWRGQCKLETWIYRIVRNVCVDALRRRSRRPDGEELDAEPGRSVAAPDRTERADLRMSLEQAIERSLSPREALAVRLIYFEGFTYREVAERLDTTVGAMSGLVYRALAKLKDAGGIAELKRTGA